jgi:hypothetical protein
MAFQREFIKYEVLTRDEIDGFSNAIVSISAAFKITNTEFPNGFAYHSMEKLFPDSSYELETFIPIEDVTDAMMEEWLVADYSADVLANINMHALATIKKTHEKHGLTTYYKRES